MRVVFMTSDDEVPPGGSPGRTQEVTPVQDRPLAEPIDVLTGLPDRIRFHSHLRQSLAECDENGASLALIVFDIDRFKQFNHVFGYHRGDAMLVAVAHAIGGILPTSDFLARLDGDEFGVVARFAGDAERGAMTLARKISARFAEGFAIGDRLLKAEVTLGIAIAPSHANSAPNLHRFADLGLHAGKIAGGNQISVFNEQIRFDFESRWTMEERLRTAIETEQIDVFYQPILDLRTGAIVGVEALARWHHATLGAIPPDEFIRIAEDNQLIRELDRQVLVRACQQTRSWIKDGKIEFFSVNLSPIQMLSDRSEWGVLTTLAELAIDPRTLVLEVTERLMLLDSPDVRSGLETLRAKGVRLALDDFGAGFSNLSYLNRFPIDRIKIDRSLVCDIEHQNFARIIVDSVTELAHRLGLQVIVEGVETMAQREVLAELGCDFAQGFWFSHALPAPDMDALLSSRAEFAVQEP